MNRLDMKWYYYHGLVLWLIFWGSISLYAQDDHIPYPQRLAVGSDGELTSQYPSLELPTDLKLILEDQTKTTLAITHNITDTWQPKGSKALLWSIIPGGGQVYNRKYWKLPIVWGALATCAYFIGFNARMYDEYHTAYRDIMSSDPTNNTAWLAFAPLGAVPADHAKYAYLKSTLQRGNDYYRRYRDLSIVLAVGIYGLSMLDAYVDAELFTFDISPDLSVRIAPSVTPPMPYNTSYQMGMACNITF